MKGKRGQSLVELAVVLPALCFSVMVIVQLVVYCHNLLALQGLAQYCSDAVAPTTRGGRALYTQFNDLWAKETPPDLNRNSVGLRSYQHYRGVSTVLNPAQLIEIDLGSCLFPGVIARSLGIKRAHATSFALREPPVPGDR